MCKMGICIQVEVQTWVQEVLVLFRKFSKLCDRTINVWITKIIYSDIYVDLYSFKKRREDVILIPRHSADIHN